MHAGADLAQVPQQLFFALEHMLLQPAAITATANIPASIAFFIPIPFLLARVAFCDP